MPREWFVYGLDENDEEHLVGIFAHWNSVISWMQGEWSTTAYYGLKIIASEDMKALIKENFSTYDV